MATVDTAAIPFSNLPLHPRRPVSAIMTPSLQKREKKLIHSHVETFEQSAEAEDHEEEGK